MDAAITAVLSDVAGMFTLKSRIKMSLKTFLGGKEVFTLLLTLTRVLGNVTVHSGQPRGGDVWLTSPLALVGTH